MVEVRGVADPAVIVPSSNISSFGEHTATFLHLSSQHWTLCLPLVDNRLHFHSAHLCLPPHLVVLPLRQLPRDIHRAGRLPQPLILSVQSSTLRLCVV
jgi:hypothetical protein